MKDKEKANIILKTMSEEGLVINWGLDYMYINAIVKGLQKVEDKTRNKEEIENKLSAAKETLNYYMENGIENFKGCVSFLKRDIELLEWVLGVDHD